MREHALGMHLGKTGKKRTGKEQSGSRSGISSRACSARSSLPKASPPSLFSFFFSLLVCAYCEHFVNR